VGSTEVILNGTQWQFNGQRIVEAMFAALAAGTTVARSS
jgi:hypothetical protein